MATAEGLAKEREELAERLKPDNCMYCGRGPVNYEFSHFPRFFYSCDTCGRRIEVTYNWVTQRGDFG